MDVRELFFPPFSLLSPGDSLFHLQVSSPPSCLQSIITCLREVSGPHHHHHGTLLFLSLFTEPFSHSAAMSLTETRSQLACSAEPSKAIKSPRCFRASRSRCRFWSNGEMGSCESCTHRHTLCIWVWKLTHSLPCLSAVKHFLSRPPLTIWWHCARRTSPLPPPAQSHTQVERLVPCIFHG